MREMPSQAGSLTFKYADQDSYGYKLPPPPYPDVGTSEYPPERHNRWDVLCHAPFSSDGRTYGLERDEKNKKQSNSNVQILGLEACVTCEVGCLGVADVRSVEGIQKEKGTQEGKEDQVDLEQNTSSVGGWMVQRL
jgi:hypothetical protein